jgi:hypothetical protein
MLESAISPRPFRTRPRVARPDGGQPGGVYGTTTPRRARVLGGALGGIAAVVRGDTETHVHLRERIVAIAALSIVVDLVCGGLVFVFERHAAGTDIKSIGSALFFSSTQLLTVSSSMANPLTTAGRVLDVLMEAYAITVVATLAGSFGAFFHRRSAERSAHEHR